MYDVLKRAICSFHRMDIKKKMFLWVFCLGFFVFICDVQYWFNARLFGGSACHASLMTLGGSRHRGVHATVSSGAVGHDPVVASVALSGAIARRSSPHLLKRC